MWRGETPREELQREKRHDRIISYMTENGLSAEEFAEMYETQTKMRTEGEINGGAEPNDSFNHFDQIGREWEKSGFADVLRKIVKGSGKLD